MPFASLSCNNYVAGGAAGHVSQISPNIVFKCPYQFGDPVQQQIDWMKESVEKMEAEKVIYQLLTKRPHPNIVPCILCRPEGIFLQKMECTLEERLALAPTAPISTETQEKWVRQLTSAVAWLESLNLVHGDLRPANILLDANEDIQLCDFDATVKPGEELRTAGVPFCKLDEHFEPPPAGPVSEQFSLASCIYTIRFGHGPWHDIDPQVMVRKVMRNEMPLVSEDLLFGDIMKRCWLGDYASIADVEKDILSRLGWNGAGEEVLGQKARIKDRESRMQALRTECERFLAEEAKGRS
ncbi:hypothetical protein DL546_004531 [Coniochaeta pulveracea]|uniref:EKC/KEOPS complex subunit BUD32 n=1 Tax=Coniochaeta pulveracea TaxID=177199 RepID=A0A420Y0R5_9PEZI|nr:hypothetical protein DL546_004531 [Coniochaeta pulveracea]